MCYRTDKRKILFFLSGNRYTQLHQDVRRETKLPRRLGGPHQPPNQHGALRFLRLPLHGKQFNILSHVID